MTDETEIYYYMIVTDAKDHKMRFDGCEMIVRYERREK